MDFDLASLAMNSAPEEQEMLTSVLAKTRRRAQEQAALRAATQNSQKMDTLAAVAPMMNNKGALAAALAAQKSQQGLAPVQMGNTGFMLPGDGSFVESPMYADEKEAARQSALLQTMERLANQRAIAEQNVAQRRDAAELNAQQRRDAADQRYALGNVMAEIARMRADAAAGAKSDRVAAAEETNREKARQDALNRVTKFSTQLDREDVPEFGEALRTAENMLARYPGDRIPGYGRAEGFVPDALSTDEMQIVRAALQGAANMLLKLRSGAAVTEPEQVRFIREVASGKGMSVAAMRTGWANLRKAYDAKVDNLVSGIDDETLALYNERAKFPLTRRAAPKPAAPKPAARTRIKFDAQGNEVPQ